MDPKPHLFTIIDAALLLSRHLESEFVTNTVPSMFPLVPYICPYVAKLLLEVEGMLNFPAPRCTTTTG